MKIFLIILLSAGFNVTAATIHCWECYFSYSGPNGQRISTDDIYSCHRGSKKAAVRATLQTCKDIADRDHNSSPACHVDSCLLFALDDVGSGGGGSGGGQSGMCNDGSVCGAGGVCNDGGPCYPR